MQLHRKLCKVKVQFLVASPETRREMVFAVDFDNRD
jgi:hypothetical protein